MEILFSPLWLKKNKKKTIKKLFNLSLLRLWLMENPLTQQSLICTCWHLHGNAHRSCYAVGANCSGVCQATGSRWWKKTFSFMEASPLLPCFYSLPIVVCDVSVSWLWIHYADPKSWHDERDPPWLALKERRQQRLLTKPWRNGRGWASVCNHKRGLEPTLLPKTT